MRRTEAPKVLVVDDDADIRASLTDILCDQGITVVAAASAEEALGLLAEAQPGLILSDIRMPGLSGLDLLRIVRQRPEAPEVVLMTAFDDMATVVSTMQEGARDFLTKPLDLHQLRTVIARIFSDQDTRATQDEPDPDTERSPDRLVGRDPRMIAIYKTVGQVAASRATVLIRGESGTGKELVARAIHAHSAAAGEPFIPVNCTALPAGLLESELFGHRRGSFTGATADRKGRFELAGSGTIFLDEIGDTAIEFQAKLLRVLEDREFFPVGAERPQRTEARIIAATHRDLEDLIGRQLFRADLYYRLRVVEITIPPLRERPSDLPALAEHLIRRAAGRLGLAHAPVLEQAALDMLLTQPWPGNVRQLENCLTRAVLLARGGVIQPVDLDTPAATVRPPDRLPTLADVEREHVVRVLVATEGNKAKAARILGVSRPRLDRLLWKHGLGRS